MRSGMRASPTRNGADHSLAPIRPGRLRAVTYESSRAEKGNARAWVHEHRSATSRPARICATWSLCARLTLTNCARPRPSKSRPAAARGRPAPHPWTAQSRRGAGYFSFPQCRHKRPARSVAGKPGGDSPHLWSPQAWLMRHGWDSALYSMASSKWSVCRADTPPFGPSSA